MQIQTLRGDANNYTWQVIRNGEMRQIFWNVFGSRASEIAMTTASWSSVPWTTEPLAVHASLGIPCDRIAIARSYAGRGQRYNAHTWGDEQASRRPSKSSIPGFTTLRGTQSGTYGTHSKPSRRSRRQNTATGNTTFLHGYEVGFQPGVTSSNGLPQANNLLTLSRDIAL